MAGQPQTQTFRSVMDFGIPRTFLSENDVLNDLNSIPGWVFDDGLGGVLTIENFGSQNVQSVTVTGSHWEQGSDIPDHAVLVSTITTISDPLSASDLAGILVGLGALIVAAVLFVFGPGGWGLTIIILALAAIGVLTLVSVVVSEITAPFSGPGGTLLSGAVLVAVLGGTVAVGAYFLRKR